MNHRMTVTEAIAEAGGVLSTGDKSKVGVLRRRSDGQMLAKSWSTSRRFIKARRRQCLSRAGRSDPRSGKQAEEVPADHGLRVVLSFARIFGVAGSINNQQMRRIVARHLPRSLLSLSFFGCAAQTGTWVRQPAGTMAWLHSVFFLDQNRGWAVGSKGTLLQTDRRRQDLETTRRFHQRRRARHLLHRRTKRLARLRSKRLRAENRRRTSRLSDEDHRWRRERGNESRSRASTSIRFSFALCSVVVDVVGRLVKEARSTPRAMPATRGVSLRSPTRRLLLGGIFVDDDRGWIVGAGATIIQTSDGGDTWYQSRLPQVEKTIRFTATSFVDNRMGWAVGSGGSVYRTVNGGRTWQRQESGS